LTRKLVIEKDCKPNFKSLQQIGLCCAIETCVQFRKNNFEKPTNFENCEKPTKSYNFEKPRKGCNQYSVRKKDIWCVKKKVIRNDFFLRWILQYL